MCRKCEICNGEIDHGVCLSCGLPAEDYIPDEDAAAETNQENTEHAVPPPSWHPPSNPN